MPRIPRSLLRKAHAIDSLLPALLAPCRDLGTARNELRWLREHVEQVAEARGARGETTVAKRAFLRRLVQERGRGKPLQYLLGSEHFGDLEIDCRPGVLIPRYKVARARGRHAIVANFGIGQIQQLPSHISSACFRMHQISRPSYAYWISAPAPAVYPSSSTTSYPARALT